MNTRELVLDTLLTLEREDDYSHRLVKSVLDKYDYLEGRDKAFIKRLTEGTIERQLELDYYLDFYSTLPVRKMAPLIRCLLRMSVYQLLYMDSVPDSAVCNEACKLAAKRRFGKLKGFVNGVLRTISRQKGALPKPSEEEEPVKYFSIEYSMPQWLVELWLDAYGREIMATLLEGLMEIRPVSLRFPSDLAEEEREALCGQLRGLGMEISRSPYLPYICLAKGFPESLASIPAFSEGQCTVQDVSSALAVEVAQIKADDFVVDVCAAPGGKSILAAEKATNGSVLARDVSEEKVTKITENALRMGRENIEVQVYDGSRLDEQLVGKADVILADVPCSGLGVMGKKRDIKYRVKKENLPSLEELQRQIVRACAVYGKPGATFVYSTCTIRREENEDMVRFLTRELGLVPVSLEGVLPESILDMKRQLEKMMRKDGKDPLSGLTEAEYNACIQLLPGYMEADGFFIARFRCPGGDGL